MSIPSPAGSHRAQRIAVRLVVTAVAIGAFMMYGSLSEEKTYDEFTGTYDTAPTVSMPLLVGGMVVMGLGTAAGLAVRPGRTTLMDFVNKHNRLNDQIHLEFKMGMDYRQQNANVELSMKF